MQKDFWGKPKKERADRWKRELRRHDTESFPDRLRRLHLLANVMTSPIGYLLHYPESKFLFDDAKNCFVFGQFAACILACHALLEYHLKGIYRIAGKDDIARLGFKRLIDRVLEDGILLDFLAVKLDELRRKRNPLVHMQNDILSYVRRASDLNITPEALLKQDAEEAILLTFEILNRHPFV